MVATVANMVAVGMEELMVVVIVVVAASMGDRVVGDDNKYSYTDNDFSYMHMAVVDRGGAGGKGSVGGGSRGIGDNGGGISSGGGVSGCDDDNNGGGVGRGCGDGGGRGGHGDVANVVVEVVKVVAAKKMIGGGFIC
ncbi:glycine-rich protein 23-like [Lactuca sativa]|uniref:glycine-rich protein 23-like n=1 Tax=Lactuca sativa TaxID=4236 RepID=UPI000CD9C18F|nr:glycine-rich protein 23-like [Lactuca sativa]